MVERREQFNISYVAHLARLELNDAEQQKLAGQLARILEYFQQLQKLDVSNVPPIAHVVPMTNVLREDEVRPCGDPARYLANAPQQTRGLFIVPKIVE